MIMEKWKVIINSIPECFQELFYQEFKDTYRTCTSCDCTYPEHRVFFRPVKYKGRIKYYTCRNCMENGVIDRYFKESIPVQTLTVYFRELLKGKKYCKHCNSIKDHIPDNFTHTKSNECRVCLGVKRLETNYFENSKLAKKGLKKCKYCMEIKALECFDLHSKSKGITVSYCKECRHIYKREKSSYDKKYLQDNIELKKDYYRIWKQNGGQLIRRENEQRREAKKLNLLSDFNTNQWIKTLEFFNFSCAYCGLHQEEHIGKYNMMLHQDHLIPVTEKGVYSDFNIVPACVKCNSTKHNHDLETFVETNCIPKERYIKILDYFLNCI